MIKKIFLYTMFFSFYSCESNKNEQSIHVIYTGQYVEKRINLININPKIKRKVSSELNVNSDSIKIDVTAICHFPVKGNTNKIDTVFFLVKTIYQEKEQVLIFNGGYKLIERR